MGRSGATTTPDDIHQVLFQEGFDLDPGLDDMEPQPCQPYGKGLAENVLSAWNLKRILISTERARTGLRRFWWREASCLRAVGAIAVQFR